MLEVLRVDTTPLSLHMEAQLHFFRIPAFFAVQNFELCKGNSNVQFPVQDSKMNPFHIIHAILEILGISLFHSNIYHFVCGAYLYL